MKKKRAVIQIGDGNTMHVHGVGVRRCAFCPSYSVTGMMRARRGGTLRLFYCRKHKESARDLWRFYRGQLLELRRAKEGRCTRCGMTRAEAEPLENHYCSASRPHPLGKEHASEHHFVEVS